MDIERYIIKECLAPIRCILKPLLFMAVAMFVLYLPLGDPQVKCGSSEKVAFTKRNIVCDLYISTIRFSYKMMEFLEFVISIIIDILYEAKLKFYAILQKFDSKDLCRSVCCLDSGREEPPSRKESRHRVCNCIRSRCSRIKSHPNML